MSDEQRKANITLQVQSMKFLLDEIPVVFTKDRTFVERVKNRPMAPGEVIILPLDALLFSATGREIHIEPFPDEEGGE